MDDLKTMIRSGQAELIDDWLKEQKGQGTICHLHEVQVYFPVATPEAHKAYKELMRTVSDVFAGATVWDGDGLWCESKPCTEDKLVEEPVKVISIWHHCTDEDERARFAQALKEAEVKTGQQSIAVKGTNRFYIIPTSELKLPKE